MILLYACSVVLSDQSHKSKLVLLPVLALEMQEHKDENCFAEKFIDFLAEICS